MIWDPGYWPLPIYLEGYWTVLVHEAIEERVEAGGGHGQQVEGDVQEVVVTEIETVIRDSQDVVVTAIEIVISDVQEVVVSENKIVNILLTFES